MLQSLELQSWTRLSEQVSLGQTSATPGWGGGVPLWPGRCGILLQPYNKICPRSLETWVQVPANSGRWTASLSQPPYL